jgi:endogenous inhibitor of DNA gyrase (YacG/DUF329 family)
MSSPGKAGGRESARLCAYCRQQPVVAAYRPFCSEGCRSRDLNAWLSDAYLLPGRPHDDELSAPSPLDNGLDKGEEAG